ncbi:MAG TPA: HAD-IA family hydrolase [Acidimicrobiales bacterium]|nr:HAD-IA family hydrolase [Acidimicrobiales bacterium]
MKVFKAVLWDFGGVISTSPFESFNRYEEANGLPRDFIRTLNATNPDTNAWAHFERNEYTIEQFARAFEAEAAAQGYTLDAVAVLQALRGEMRPEVFAMIDAINDAGLMNAGVTNNFAPMEPSEWHDKFTVIIESSRVGVRKPDPRFYSMACDALGVTPVDCVYLDDLGINLKPANAMGMTTIKFVDPAEALAQLKDHLGL